MFWPPLLLDLLLLCRRRRRRRRYYCCCCCCAVTRSCVRSIKHETRNSLLRRVVLRDASRVEKQQRSSSTAAAQQQRSSSTAAAQQQRSSSTAAAQQQQQQRRRRRWRRRGSNNGQLPFGVSGWPLCCVSVAERVCALSVPVHPGCPSLPWLRGFGLGIKLGAYRPIVWTAEARMNLERSSVQIVRSSGKFRAVFCKVRTIWFLRGGFVVNLGRTTFIANTLICEYNRE